MKLIAETPAEIALLDRIKITSDELATQDNLVTNFPIWYVTEIKKVERSDGEFKERLDYDAITEDKLCESCRKLWEEDGELPEDCDNYFCEDSFWHFDKEREFTSYGSMFFFTQKACQDYIDSNRYHFNEPEPYAGSAFRNGELEDVIHLLLLAGQNEINSNHYGRLE